MSIAGVKALQSIGLRTIEVEDFGDPCAAAEGSFLSSFVYNEFKSKKDSPVDISSWQTERTPGGPHLCSYCELYLIVFYLWIYWIAT
jgi:hypothetical protein